MDVSWYCKLFIACTFFKYSKGSPVDVSTSGVAVLTWKPPGVISTKGFSVGLTKDRTVEDGRALWDISTCGPMLGDDPKWDTSGL